MAADTFLLTLPDGQKVRCWTRDFNQIRLDIQLTGNVTLIRDEGKEVYERLAPEEIAPANARHVTGP